MEERSVILLLDELSKKLGVTGETLFKYLIEQKFISGFTNLLGGISLITIGFLTIYFD